jgi:hypothetical protein
VNAPMRRFGQARVSFDQLQVFEKRTLPLLLLALFSILLD